MTDATLADSQDVIVVGAGPAGLAAATELARAGVGVALLDELAAPGGQIYRAITTTPLTKRELLGEDYWRGAELVEAFRESGAIYVPRATVWSLSRECELGVSIDGAARMIAARQIIVATGALERPFPIPGWTLPGVMTVGAAQILLKSTGRAPSGRIVIAGTGPLIWLLAWQYINAGVEIAAILDITKLGNATTAWRHAPAFAASRYFKKGIELMLRVRERVRVVSRVDHLRVLGDTQARGIAYRIGAAEPREEPADIVLLHQGVVPNINLAAAAGCGLEWDDAQRCFRPIVDGWFMSDIEGIFVAGDGAGIGGAEAAAHRGRLAAIGALHRLGKLDAAQAQAATREHRRELARAERGRAFLDTAFMPPDATRRPDGDTIVCRCEEVTAQQVIDAAKQGCTGPNQLKSFLRCGMGPCQGRMCSLTVTELIAATHGLAPGDVGTYRLRPPVKPITLAELAAMPRDQAAIDAVIRR
jgi:NADPH-dependent 2,4-dienoyl-CoA reductase/sulfur reductase-like enzyme